MSDTALREAAERLLRNQRETFEYPPGAGYYDDTADLELVCGKVLRECDELPISEEWLRSVGGIEDEEYESYYFRGVKNYQRIRVYSPPAGGWKMVAFGGALIGAVPCESRGQLRLLAAALNIPLKETQVSQ